nr:hypothetical protein [Tanacetum cinerariifolium]
MTSITSLCEMACQFVQQKLEEKQIEEERAAKVQNWKFPVCYDDDDDEERSDSLDDNIISGLPSFSAITPDEHVLSTEEPDNSLRESDFFLEVDAILAVEDEFTSSQFPKSYLDPEGDMLLFKAFLNDDHSSDFKTKSSSTSLNSLLEETNNFDNSLPKFTTFSNVLFDDKYESDSSDDQSCSDEDVLEKIISKPLSEEEIIPMKSLQFVSANSDAESDSFSPSPVLVKDSDSLMKKNDLFCTPDYPMPPGIVDKDYDSERDILIQSDEFIKSCVENLVPNPSESEGENECDVPASFTTFSNVLFDADYDFDSGDDQLTSDEDFPKRIYSNPLFDEEINPMKIDQHSFNAESDVIEYMPNHDSSITISLKIDSPFDEFSGKLTLLKSIPPGFDETDCHPEKETHFPKRLLYDNSSPSPPEEIVFDNSNADIKSFSPSPIPVEDSDSHMEEIDLPFTLDDPMSPGIEDDDYDSGRDIPILEELLDKYSLSLPAMSHTIFIFLYLIVLLQNHHMEKSPDLLSHQGFEAFQPSAECPMIINGKNIPLLDVPLFHFYPP